MDTRHDDALRAGAETPEGRLSRELETYGHDAPRALLESITDRYVVRHPGLADRLRAVLTRLKSPQPPEPPPSAEDATSPRLRSSIAGRSISLPEVELPDGAPRELDHYRLLRELGRGGMGVVYLAFDEELRRLVAVKLLAAELAGHSEFLERFEREEMAVAKLNHPGIVPVYGLGEDSGVPYFVMRYVDGLPLGDWIKALQTGEDGEAPGSAETTALTAGRIPVPGGGGEVDTAMLPHRRLGDILHVIELTARALDHAHQNGITHRDVKPSNVIVDREGNPHLLDFGLAKLVSDRSLTQPGRLMGTVPYMSPEQVATKRIPLDHRTDIYSLGVTLFECLTGVRPFTGPEPENIMFQILMRDPPSPRGLNPELTRDIETVTLRCMEKDPADRYQSCDEVAEELARIRAHRQIEAEPVGRLGRAYRWAKRNRALAILACVGLIALLVAAAMPVRRGMILEAQRRSEAERQSDLADAMVERLDGLTARRTTTGDRERVGLEAEISRARETAFHHFGRSLAEWPDEEVVRARNAFLFAWYEDASESGDARAVALRRALEDSDHAAELSRGGRFSLETDPPGARVTAWRYRPDVHGRMVHDSCEPIELGISPIEDAALPVGSYRVRIELEGRLGAWYPILVEHDEHWGDASWHGGAFADRDWTVRLVAAADHSEILDIAAWRHVPCGPFLSTAAELGHRGLSPPMEWRWVEGFLMQGHEETFGRYNAYLRTDSVRDHLAESPPELLDYVPRCYVEGRDRARMDVDRETGRIVGLDESQPDVKEFVELPACGLRSTWALDYAAWFGARLPSTLQWEKAARGVDGRLYPWGNVFDWSFTVGRRSLAEPLGPGGIPAAAGTRPLDESPYGIIDLAGNVREWCRDTLTRDGVTYRYLAGGSRGSSLPEDHVCWVHASAAHGVFGDFTGFRMVVEPGR